MTLSEFKAAHPAVYAEARAEGISAEQTRVKTWMAYEKIDPTAVATGIKEGKEVTADVTAEMMVKAMSVGGLERLKKDNAATITTPEAATTADLTPEQKAAADFMAACKVDLGLK